MASVSVIINVITMVVLLRIWGRNQLLLFIFFVWNNPRLDVFSFVLNLFISSLK